MGHVGDGVGRLQVAHAEQHGLLGRERQTESAQEIAKDLKGAKSIMLESDFEEQTGRTYVRNVWIPVELADNVPRQTREELNDVLKKRDDD